MEAVAKLNNYPTSPRKMRLLVDEIRGIRVEKALAYLEHHPQHAATPLLKLLKSAINNWEQKNQDKPVEDAELIVSEIFVDQGRTIRRMRPAPQGRGYRIRKRSNHVTLYVDSLLFASEANLDNEEEIIQSHHEATEGIGTSTVIEEAQVVEDQAAIKKSKNKKK